MVVADNGGRSLDISGYNNVVTNITVFGNGCGGISLSGGEQVSETVSEQSDVISIGSQL